MVSLKLCLFTPKSPRQGDLSVAAKCYDGESLCKGIEMLQPDFGLQVATFRKKSRFPKNFHVIPTVAACFDFIAVIKTLARHCVFVCTSERSVDVFRFYYIHIITLLFEISLRLSI